MDINSLLKFDSDKDFNYDNPDENSVLYYLIVDLMRYKNIKEFIESYDLDEFLDFKMQYDDFEYNPYDKLQYMLHIWDIGWPLELKKDIDNYCDDIELAILNKAPLIEITFRQFLNLILEPSIYVILKGNKNEF